MAEEGDLSEWRDELREPAPIIVTGEGHDDNGGDERTVILASEHGQSVPLRCMLQQEEEEQEWQKNSSFCSPQHSAFRVRQLLCIESTRDGERDKPIHLDQAPRSVASAVASGDLPEVKRLVEVVGLDVNGFHDGCGGTLLHLAVGHGHSEASHLVAPSIGHMQYTPYDTVRT